MVWRQQVISFLGHGSANALGLGHFNQHRNRPGLGGVVRVFRAPVRHTSEELTLTSLIHTVSANIPGILKVKILVDGKERETLAGHADLSDFYDVTAVNQLALQLQSTP